MDYSEDIKQFREAVNNAVAPRILALRKECDRLDSVRAKGLDEYYKKHWALPVACTFMDFIKLVAQITNPRQQTSNPNQAGFLQMELDRLQARQKEINDILDKVSSFCSRVDNCFVQDTTISYASYLKIEGVDNGMTPNSAISFLVSLIEADKLIGEDIVKLISKRYDIKELQSMLAAKQYHAAEISLSLSHNGYKTIAKDLSSIAFALNGKAEILQSLDACKNICAKINNKYFLRFSGLSSRIPAGINDCFILEGQKDYREFLNQAIELAPGRFTKTEIACILGHEPDEMIASKDEKHAKQPKYVEPQGDYSEFFSGLKDELKDLSKLNEIIRILIEFDCVDECDSKVLLYRLCGNQRPAKLYPIKWKSKKSKAIRKFNRESDIRHPNELYYLIRHMYNYIFPKDKVLIFFSFDDVTLSRINEAFLKKDSSITQQSQSAPTAFQEALHNRVSDRIFTIKRRKNNK